MEIKLTERSAIVKDDSILYTSSVPIESLTDFLQIKPRTDSLLPKNCRYFSMTNNYTCIFVIEEDPQIRTIHVNHPQMVSAAFSKFKSLGVYDVGSYRSDQKTFTLSFPYIIYIISIESSRSGWFELVDISIFFRTNPLQSLGDWLYHLPILNRYDNGKLCMSPVQAETPNEVVSDAVEAFWASEFNDDIEINQPIHVPIVNNLFEWDYMTKKNPLFILNLKLEPAYPLKASLYSSSTLDFSSLLQILTGTNFESTTSPLLHGQSDVLAIGDCAVYRGDTIEFQNKDLEVLSFVSRNGNQRTYIYGKIGNKKSFFKLTDTFRNVILRILEEKQIRSVSSQDGRIFSVGDIYTIQNQYFQISKIRPSIGTNDYELFCDNKLFMLSDFSKVAKKFDPSRYTGNVLVTWRHHYFKKFYVKQVIEKVTCKYNYVYLENIGGDSVDIHDVIQLEHLQQIGSGPYRIGSSISMITNAFRDRDDYILLEEESNDVNLDCTDKFFIKGFDIDLSFEKGDKVVCASTDPKSRLHVHEITDIQGTGDSVVFTIRSALTGEEKKLTYIRQSTVMLLGQVRKVVLEYEGVHVGQRIVAKRSRIPYFPKHEVNEIVAFVIDHVSEPLVLCSNGCTIWWSALSTTFDVLNRSSKVYKKELAPIKTLRLQLGDLVFDADLCRTGWYTCKCAKDLGFPFYDFWNNNQARLQILGVPEPRVPVKYATNPMFHIKGFSLGHGTYYSPQGFTVLDHNKLKREVFGV